MPTIAAFQGIIVRMWHDDHPPPHVHVSYQGFEAEVDISKGTVSNDNLPPRVAGLIRHWCARHKFELLQNWQRAKQFEPLVKIRSEPDD